MSETTKSKKRYHAVEGTRRLLDAGDDMEKQVKAIQDSALKPDVKAAAIAGIKAEGKSDAGIEIMADTVGDAKGKHYPDQFRVFGPGFNTSKQQSPRLLDLILDNVAFFEKFRKTVWKEHVES